jgi:hypothetical protein
MASLAIVVVGAEDDEQGRDRIGGQAGQERHELAELLKRLRFSNLLDGVDHRV